MLSVCKDANETYRIEQATSAGPRERKRSDGMGWRDSEKGET